MSETPLPTSNQKMPPWVQTALFFSAAAFIVVRYPTAAMALFSLGVLIFVHELGHFSVAKWQGMRVEMFSIGFGPPLFKFQRGETVYQIAAFPLGGFVKPAGEDPKTDEDIANAKPDEFMGRPWWSRALVVLAGPVTNLVFPLLMMFLVYATLGRPNLWGPPQVETIMEESGAAKAGMKLGDLIVSINGVPVNSGLVLGEMVNNASREDLEKPLKVIVMRDGKEKPLTVRTTLNGEAGRYLMGVSVVRSPLAYGTTLRSVQVISPAEKAGLKKGDRVLKVDGHRLSDGGGFSALFGRSKSDPVNILVLRDGKELTLTAPKKQPIPESWASPEQIGLLGVEFDPAEGEAALKRRDKLDLKDAALNALSDTMVGVQVIVFGVKETILGRIKAKDALGGPIAIMRMAKQQADKGWDDLFNLMVSISLTLGLMNLLPIPILDGGTLVLCLIEGLRGKPLRLKTQAVLQNVGLALMLSLFAFTIVNDISRLLHF